MRRALLVLLLLLLAACQGPSTPADPLADLRGLPLVDTFEAVAEDQGVPPDLLLALGWHQTSLTLPEPGEHDHGPAAVGWLGLQEERLQDCAALTGLAPEALHDDPVLALWAAAGWLREHAETGASVSIPDAAWWPAVRDLPGFDEPWLADEFAMSVFGTLQEGLVADLSDGEVLSLPAWDLPGLEDIDVAEGPGAEDGDFSGGGVVGYPGRARYLPAHPNGNGGLRSGSIRRIVIHTIEGSYEGGIAWARNPTSNAGFQYIIRRSDGEVTQMVPDNVMGWHACNNNGDTIGIEHEGHASSASTWTAAQVDASARLSGWLARRYGIPVDRDHIVGHGEIQPSGCNYRYDPGPHFPWSQYMQKVAWYKAHSWDAGEAPAPKLAIDVPRNGQQVGNPFLTRVRVKNVDHIRVYLGARKVVGNRSGALLDLPISPAHGGWKRLQVRAFDEAGVRIAKKTIRVRIRPSVVDVAPQADKIHELDYLLSAASDGEPAWVRYWTNGGRALRGELSDRLRAHPDDYELVAGFVTPNRKLLLTRAYRADGRVIGEGWSYVDADESPGAPAEVHDLDALPMPGTTMQVAAVADPAVAWVRYKVDGQWVVDAVTGEDRALGPDYSMFIAFDGAGEHELKAKGYDAAGNPRSTLTETVDVPSSGLVVAVERIGALRYVLDAAAPAGTERVVFYAGTQLLTNANTGQGFAPYPAFRFETVFPSAGPVVVTAVARDPVGNVLGSVSLSVDAW